jgi:DNA-binding CsgD family transcriptional regulator
VRSSTGQTLVRELAEEFHGLPDPGQYPYRLLQRLESLLGVDSAICFGLSPQRVALATRNKQPYRRFLKRLLTEPQRYEADVSRSRSSARAQRGVSLDTEVFSRRELHQLPFFSDLIRPQGISSQITGLVELHGRPLASLQLCRHGRGRPFGARELRALRDLMPLLALAHAALLNPVPTLPSLDVLRPREREVAQLVVQGLRNREIAALLGSSPFTVRNQLARVFDALGVESRTELAVWVEREARARSTTG